MARISALFGDLNGKIERKKKWIIQQFRAGRSATSIAQIQKISRRMVYKLVHKHKKFGIKAYTSRQAGRPKMSLNSSFVKKVAELRKTTDYGSKKLHFVLENSGFGVSQHIIQRILNEQGLIEPCEKRRGQRKYVRFQ